MRAFDSQSGCHRFLIPPQNRIDTTDTHEMCNFYTWTFSSGIGESPPIRRGRITPAYYPGWTPEQVKILLDQRSRAGAMQAQQKLKTVSFAQAVSQTLPAKPLTSFNQPMGAQPFVAPTPLPPAPVSNGAEYSANFHDSELFFKDVHGSLNPPPITSTTIPSGGATFASAAAGQNKPNKPSAPINPKTKRPVFQHRQIYTLRFSRDAPWKGVQTPAHIVVDKINVACEKMYKIKAILARWTEKNNLTVTFTNESKDKDIENAAKTIINILAQGYSHVSQTRKLITQIARVCQELRNIVQDRSIKTTQPTTQSQPSNDHKGKEPQSSTYEKGEEGYTHLKDSKTCDHYADRHNNLNNPARHAEPSPRTIPPSILPSPTSSHASSEASSSEPSTSSDELPSCWTGGNVGEMMALSSSQKETKESLEGQDSRGGGLPCPDETSEWRSLNKAGIGDCRKSPKMGHWQHNEGLEL